MGDPVKNQIQKTEQNQQFEINTQNQVQENRVEVNPQQMQVAQNINANQKAADNDMQPGEFEYKGHRIKKWKSSLEQAEKTASEYQMQDVRSLGTDMFDLVSTNYVESLRKDKEQPGGLMESADYIYMQESKIRTKLEQSDIQNRRNKYDDVAGFGRSSEKSWNKKGMTFKKFIFPDKLQKDLKDIDLTDAKQVKEVRAQLKEAMNKCDEIMNPVYQEKSDKIFKYAKENKSVYFAKLEEEKTALDDVLGDASLNLKESEEKVLGGSSLLHEKHGEMEYFLRDREKLTVKQKTKNMAKVKEYVKEKNKILEQLGSATDTKTITGLQNSLKKVNTKIEGLCSGSFCYEWNPEEVLEKARENRFNVMLDKDGKPVKAQRTTASPKDMQAFAQSIKNSMREHIINYCIQKFDLADDKESRDLIDHYLLIAMGENDNFSKVDALVDAKLKTKTGEKMKATWDLSTFTQSAAVQQMQSLSDYAQEYGTLLNEKPFYEFSNQRIDELGGRLKVQIKVMDGTFRVLDQRFNEILEKNSIKVDSQETDPVEKTHNKVEAVVINGLDKRKYKMSNVDLYTFYRGFIKTLRESVVNKGSEYYREGDDVIHVENIRLNIVPEQVKKLNEAYEAIDRSVEAVVADYAKQKGIDHDENPDGVATATKKFSLQDIADGGAEWDELKNEPLWSLYQMVHETIGGAINEINHFKEDIEEFGIKKDAQVGAYYDNVKEVKKMLKDSDTNIENHAMTGDIAEAYKEMMALKQEMIDLQKEEPKSGDGLETDRKTTEAEMIARGRRVYIVLARCNALGEEVALRWDFLDNIQGRNIIEDLGWIKGGLCYRLSKQKKEELAYFEGSLLRKEMNALMNEGLAKKKDVSAQEQIMQMADAYSQVKEKIDNYLERYADIKERCYYVKSLELRQESFSRQISELTSKTTVTLCNDVTKEMELDNKFRRGDFDENTGKRLEELSKKVESETQLDAKETEEWLNKAYDLYMASGTLAEAGMNTAEIMEKLGYPKNLYEKRNGLIYFNTPSLTFNDFCDKEAAREWFSKKLSGLRGLYDEMVSRLRQKTGNAEQLFRDRDKALSYIDYLVSQTELGRQIRLLGNFDFELGVLDLCMESDDWKYISKIRSRMSSYSNAAGKYGLETENKELREQQAADTYRNLKMNTNLEARYERARTRFQEKKGSKIRDALKRLKKADGLIAKNSQFFENVMKAAADLETLENNPDADYAVLKEQYAKVMQTAEDYIKARANWRNAWTDDGKERLNAVRELKEAVGSTSNVLEETLAVPHENLEETKKLVAEKAAKLKAFREKMAASKGVSEQAMLVEFRKTFEEELKNFDNEKITGINAGVDYMTELKAEEMKLHRLGNKWIQDQVDDIKKACFEKDPGNLTQDEQYKMWAKCYGFYVKYKDECTEESKKALESLEILSREYVNETDSKTLMDAIKKDQENAKKCAAGTNTDAFTMLRLKWKYQKFLKGVDANLGFFIDGYEQFRSSMEEISRKPSIEITGRTGTALLRQARADLDVRLQNTRDELAKSNFADATSGKEVIGKLRDCLTELNFFEETFGILRKDKAYDAKEKGYKERQEYNISIMNYYRTQKEGLEAILASYAVRDIVVSDMNLSFEKDLKRKQYEQEYGTISKVELADKRLWSVEYGLELESGDDAIYSKYIKFIVATETERKQLDDMKELAKSEPEMAEEVQKQTVIRQRFEQYLKEHKDMEPRHQEKLRIAFQDYAQNFVKALDEKLEMISKEHLGGEEERLICYISSLSKRYDEARMFIDLAVRWSKTYENVKIDSPSFTRLVELVNYIDRESAKAKKQKGFEKIAENMKDQADDLKMEDAKMHYSTEEICKRRDENFAISLRNLGELKLTSLDDMRVNEKVKAERMRYSVESYDKMKVKKNNVFKLFGFRLWGQEFFSMDDFINRLEQYAFEYENSWEMEKKKANMGKNAVLECPFNAVVRDMKLIKELGKRLSEPDKLDEKEIQEIPAQFKKLMGGLDRKFNDACREVIGYPSNDMLRVDEKTGKEYFKETGEEYTKDYRKKLEEEEKKLKMGWGQLFGVLRGIPKQVDQYMDRRPNVQKKALNHELRDHHRMFIRQMSILKESIANNEPEDVQDKKFFEALRLSRLGENQYAESAMEHNVNMECSLYSQYLSSLAESKCFKRSQDTMKKLAEMSPEERQENAVNVYNDFMKYMTRFYLSSGISETFFKSMKEHMDVQMKLYDKKSMNPQELREFQYGVLEEMVKEIEIPFEVPGDSLSTLKKELAEMSRDVLKASGGLMIRCLNILYLGDKAEQLKLDSEEFLKAAEYLNSSSLWRFILRMHRRIKAYWKARGALF